MSHRGAKIGSVLGLLVVLGLLRPDDARSVPPSAQGPQQVLVVNPAGDPARTAVVGPVTATIANTPAQAVPVTVEGTPSVAVSGAVTVANTEAQAIPVRVINAAPIPWVGGGQILIDPGEQFDAEQFFAPPPGQRLVIEAFSIEVSLPTGQIATQATILASAGGEGAMFRFPLPSVPGSTPTHDRFSTMQLTKLNVSGGVIVSVSRNATAGTGLVNVAVSGHLVEDR